VLASASLPARGCARVAVTIAILWYLLTIVPVAVIRDVVAAAIPLWIIAGLTAQILLHMLNALRIRVIARAQGGVARFATSSDGAALTCHR
jgi:hypothetical protein